MTTYEEVFADNNAPGCLNLAGDVLRMLRFSTADCIATMAATNGALFVGVVALLVIFVSMALFKRQKSRLPPGPTPLPIIGCLHLLGAHLPKTLADLAQKYGPVMSLPLGQRLCIVATSPEVAKEFLKIQDSNFSSRPSLRSAELLYPGEMALHDITPERRHLRKILVSELMTVKRLEASRYIRTEEIAYMLSTISKETAPVRVKTHLTIMANNIFSRMVLSKRFLGGTDSANDSEIQEFLAIVEEQLNCVTATDLRDLFNVPDWCDPRGLDKRCRKLRARMDAFYTNLTNQHKEERRKNPLSEDGQKNLLDVLLEQLDSPEHGVTEENVNGFVWDVIGAGTETTMTTSEWAMTEVLRNPAIVKEARSELDRVVGHERTVQESDIPELKYIQAIIKETLRLHPPVPLLIPHQNTHATEAFGYDIPAKTRVFVNVYAIGRDPQIWEKPLEFVPERFLQGAPHGTTEFQGQHFELTPFGAGRRMCPGMAFGSVTVQLQVANLLHAFDWSFPDGVAPETLDMTEAPIGMSLHKRDPLVAIAKPRLPTNLY